MLNIYKKLLRRKIIFGSTVGAAIFFMTIGVIYWGVFNMALEVTNDMSFCISCHEMENNVYQDYLKTSHYKNRTGVRATCPDCHVPKEWEHMVVRKIGATQELLQKILGTINTREKFESHRLEMAESVWQSMESTNSRECRNCHAFDAMETDIQSGRSGLIHQYAQETNKTCINCHKGIAHSLPAETEIYKGGSDADHDYFEQQSFKCHQCHEDMPNSVEEDWGF
ncbi:MAG: cytochrome C [Alteromonadaceae bacterium]|nr:MAG: cytochrome C [Alteromonadaceae bacterium]